VNSLSSPLLAKVAATVHRYALFKPNDSVVVACSGGPDSLSLLGVLREFSESFPLQLTAVYVDHGLRLEAADEGRFVCSVANKLGLPAVVQKVSVDLKHSPGESVQVAARRERYRLLEEVAKATGSCCIATGHTADDQAETVLLRILRGTGSQGLAGIPYINGRLRRPLLDARRADTEQYCRLWGVEPRRDPSNEEDVYLRNQIRHHIVPLLTGINPRLVEALCRLAETTQTEQEWFECLLADRAGQFACRLDGGWWLYTNRLAQQHKAWQRRLVRWYYKDLQNDVTGQELDFEHVEALLEMVIQGRTGASLSLPNELVAHKEKNGLWLGAPVVAANYEVPLSVPGVTPIPGTDLAIVTAILEGTMPTQSELQEEPTVQEAVGPWQPQSRSEYVDYDSLQGSLKVRNWRAGDRYQPLGLVGTKKLQDMLVDAGIPRRWRLRLPVMSDAAGIVWAAGARPAERVKVNSGSSRLLQIKLVISN
jgi:tRNA(Ile)-lysidine synthase